MVIVQNERQFISQNPEFPRKKKSLALGRKKNYNGMLIKLNFKIEILFKVDHKKDHILFSKVTQ